MSKKMLFLVFALLLLSSISYANQIKILEQNDYSMTCEWTAKGYKIQNYKNYCLVNYKAVCDHTKEYGKAMLPSANFVFQIKNGISGIDILETESKKISLNKQIYPTQHPFPDLVGVEDPEFTKDEEFYKSSNPYPGKIVNFSKPGIMRGIKLLNINIIPVSYVPADNNIEAYTKIKFKINFDLFVRFTSGSDGEMDVIAKNMVVNFSPSAKKRASRDSVELLILTKDTLLDQANSFANWKKEQGFTVAVESFSNPTVETAQAKIQEYYDNHNTVYFLIFGDYEVFPMPLTDYNHPYHGKKFPTDVIYACVDGSDYYPDLYHGRIPAKNNTEAQNMIDKIIGYEKDPEPGDWYNRCCLCGEFQNSYIKNKAERLFCETAYVIYENLKNRYIFPTTKTIGAGTPPGSGDTYYFNSGSLAYRTLKGQALPQYWQDRITTSSAAATNTLNFWEQGAFLVQHRDHGNYKIWGKPAVNASNLANLTNGGKLPVLLSINCLTGGLDTSGDCLSEAAIKNPNGGAVAVFGATRVSYSGWNDNLCDGFYVCFNEGYNTFSKATPNYENKYPTSHRIGIILNYGKYYMMKNKGTGSTCKVSFHLFQCYGDPSMYIRNQVPENINVSHPANISGSSFTVTVKDSNGANVTDALVCLYNNANNQQVKGVTNSNGQITLGVSDLSNGTFKLTVSGLNLRPYQTEVKK